MTLITTIKIFSHIGGLTKVGVALGHFLATVWDANGNWLKLASRHVKDKSQLLDLQNSLDDAIRLQQAGEKGVEVEGF